MKRKWTIVVIVLLTAYMIGCLLWLTGGTTQIKKLLPFDPETTGVVDVVVVDHHGEDDTPHYYHIGAGRIKREAEPFEPEEMVVYKVDTQGLECYIDREKNKVLNRLRYINIYDEQSNLVENTLLLEAVVTQAATLEHNIMELYIFQVGSEVFVQTELNVNWWCPCELYWYDQQNDHLVELYTFDGLEVVGMRIRDLERAR